MFARTGNSEVESNQTFQGMRFRERSATAGFLAFAPIVGGIIDAALHRMSDFD